MDVSEIKRIASGFRSGMLGKQNSAGWCGKICDPLVGYLSFVKIKCYLVDGIV